MLKCDFNKWLCSLIENTLQHGRSSMNLLQIFRIPSQSNISEKTAFGRQYFV